MERLLRFFTKIDVEEIKQMCKQDILKAKRLMVFEVTKLVHGEEEALKVQETAKNLFEKSNINTDNMPTEIINHIGEINIVDFLSQLTIIKSKSEARRLVEQSGIVIDKEKITDTKHTITLKENQEVIVKKGKKTFIKVLVKK